MQTRTYTVDLTAAKKNGEFACEKCGVTISPEDFTENVYKILKTVVKDDTLEKLILKCNLCQSTIQLVGFHTFKQE